MNDTIKFLADDYGWRMLFEKPANKLLRFEKDNIWIDYWWTSGTIGIYRNTKAIKYLKNGESLEDVFKDYNQYV